VEGLKRIHDLFVRLSRFLAYFGAAFIAAMTLLIVLDVVLRYFYNAPMMGAHEVVEYLLLLTFFLFLPDCWNAGSHVRMEIVYEKAVSLRRVFDAIIGISGALLFAGMAWKIFEELQYAIGAGQVSSELMFPIWPFKLVAFLCLLIFIVQLGLAVVIPPDPHKNHSLSGSE